MNSFQVSFKTAFTKFGLVVLALLTIFFFLPMPNKTYATSGSIYTVATNAGKPPWGYPIDNGLRGKIARDSVDNLYAVYISLGGGSKTNIYLAKSTDQGQTWTSEAVTTGTDYDQWHPSVALDSQDNIHVVWSGATADSPDMEQIRYREYTSGAWQPIVELTTAADYDQYNPSIALDSHDNIHVAWGGATADSPSTSQIRYREYTNGAWQPIVELTTAADYWQWGPSVALDSHDNVHVAWEGYTATSPSNEQISYRKYTDGAWQPIVELTTAADYDQEAPSIALDSHDNVHVAWVGVTADSPDNYQIRYREYTNGAWQPIVELTTDYDSWGPSVAIDSHDNIHVVWYGHAASSPSTYQIRYREYISGAWQTIENLTSSENNQYYPNLIWAEYPKACNAQTNVTKDGFFLIWSEDTGQQFNVKDYVSSDLDWQTQSCSEPTPTPTSTPTPSATPTPATDNSNITILPETGADL